MDVLPGSPSGIRSAASQLDAWKKQIENLDRTLSCLVERAGEAGTFAGGDQLRAVLIAHRETVRSLVPKVSAAHAALEHLAAELESLDAWAAQATAIPVAGVPTRLMFCYQAERFRSDAASVLVSGLPPSTIPMLVEYPGVGTSLKHIWERGVVDTVKGVLGLGKGLYDLSPLRLAIDPGGYAKSWQNVGSSSHALFQAVVFDQFSDGSSGARQKVLDALREIPDEIIDRDLMEKDPSAWFVIYGITVASLLIGGTEAKIATKALEGLSKGVVTTGNLAKIAALVGADAGSLRAASATTKVLEQYPRLFNILEYPLRAPSRDGWSYKGHDFSGRLVFEDSVLELLQKIDPGAYKLKARHDVIDISSVNLMNPGDGRLVSVKSLDPTFSWYQNNPQRVGGQLLEDVDRLRYWGTPAQPRGTPFVSDSSFEMMLGAQDGRVFFGNEDALIRDLYLVLPSDGLSDAHAASLDKAIAKIEQVNRDTGMNVQVHILEVRR